MTVFTRQVHVASPSACVIASVCSSHLAAPAAATLGLATYSMATHPSCWPHWCVHSSRSTAVTTEYVPEPSIAVRQQPGLPEAGENSTAGGVGEGGGALADFE